MENSERQPIVLPDIYCQNLMLQMNTLRQEKSLCDVNLVVESSTFPAHRIVLSAGSPFFHGLFTSQMKEKQEKEIVLKEVKAAVMEDVLGYLYTGQVDVNSLNAEDLVTSASYFLIDGLKEEASSFVRSSLNVENCLRIREFAEEHHCESLEMAAKEFIGQHFGEIIEIQDFLQLGFDKLEEFIASENTVVSKEEEIYDAIKKWVEKSPATRKKYFKDLFHHVRLSLLSRKFLNSVVLQDELVTGNVSCMQFVVKSRSNVQSLPPIQRPRKCLDPCVDAIVISGGLHDEYAATDSTMCFVPDLDNSWFALPQLSSARYNNALAYCDGFLYSIGGLEDQNTGDDDGDYVAVKDVERYDPKINSWLSVCPLPQVEKMITAASLDGQLYALGRSKVYRYTPGMDVWCHITSTQEELQGASLVADSSSLYIIGGLNKHNDVMNNCQKYNPELDKWMLLAPMDRKRYLASAVYKNKQIYVVGGRKDYGSTIALTSSEIYSIEDDVWITLPSLLSPRHSAGITCMWDDILILGGKHKGEQQNTIERYNESQRQWEVFSTMPCRSYFSCSWVRMPKHFLDLKDEESF